MDKKEKSAWAIFFTSITLSFVFVSLLSFKGCGSNSGGSGGGSPRNKTRVENRIVEENDCFRSPEVLSLVSAFNNAKSDMDKSTALDEFRNFILKGARSLESKHDSNIEQLLKKKSPPNSLIGVYKRAVPLLYGLLVQDVGSKSLSNIAVFGGSIKEGVFRKASEKEKGKYRTIVPDFSSPSVGSDFPNIIPDFSDIDPKEYENYRLIEDHNFESNGSLSPLSNGGIFFIKQFPTISFWYKTEEEKDLALGKKVMAPGYGLTNVPVLLKKSELLSIGSIEEYGDKEEVQKQSHGLSTFEGFFEKGKASYAMMKKIGDVPPKEGSNLKELWVYSFALKAETENIPLAGSFYLVKIHVG